MAVRKIVHIDEELCNGCGECVPACAEGAIQIVDGVAKLVADNLCDGLGACLGECPQGAIRIEERDASDFSEEAVHAHLGKKGRPPEHAGAPSRPPAPEHPHAREHSAGGGCPGARMLHFDQPDGPQHSSAASAAPQRSELRQWPIQLHLVQPTAPYFKKADVLLAADCVAFSVGNFHNDYLKGRSLAIACPKLDDGMEVYLDKLVTMIDEALINSLTVMIMEVPCCSGLVHVAKEAAARAKRKVPIKQIVVGLRGDILDEQWI